MNIFHERLKNELKRLNVSQSELGRILGVSQQSVWRWLNEEEPSLNRFRQICDVLKLDANYLLGLSPTGGGIISNIYLLGYNSGKGYIRGGTGGKRRERGAKIFPALQGRGSYFPLVSRYS